MELEDAHYLHTTNLAILFIDCGRAVELELAVLVRVVPLLRPKM